VGKAERQTCCKESCLETQTDESSNEENEEEVVGSDEGPVGSTQEANRNCVGNRGLGSAGAVIDAHKG
jgi:hypothetical protein